jgi:hypothetical protein
VGVGISGVYTDVGSMKLIMYKLVYISRLMNKKVS